MKVGIRADASVFHGAGHVMRCLTLARELRSADADVFFLSRALPGNLFALIEKQGFMLFPLPYEDKGNNGEGLPPPDADRSPLVPWDLDIQETMAILAKNLIHLDWLIVDGYAFDFRWEERSRVQADRIMVIDDMANRVHDCDLLLDQNYLQDYEARYEQWTPPRCRKLLGPQYALLRSEFNELRKFRTWVNKPLKKLSLFFSASDPENETEKALRAIAELGEEIGAVDVIVGAANVRKERIGEICASLGNVEYHCQVENMAFLMSKADLAVGAAGSSAWERCCLGLPAVVTVLSADQAGIGEALNEYGAVHNLGWFFNVGVQDYVRAIRALSAEELKSMAERGMMLVDGLGVRRVVGELLKA